MHLERAAKTVETAIKSGQIGTPVAARVFVHTTSDHGLIEPLSARSLELAARWLGGQLELLAAQGSVVQGQITVLMRLAGGQTALVSAGASGVGSPSLGIVVFGSRGVVSWVSGDQTSMAAADDRPQFSDAARELQRRLRRALQSRQAITLEGDASRDSLRPLAPGRVGPRGEASAVLRRQKPPYGLLLVAGDHTHQPGYAEALTADPRCRLVGLSDEEDVTPRRKRLNEQLARRLHIPVFADLPSALAREDVDIASICAAPRRRGCIIVQAAEAGKHLYLDKPLAGSLADVQRIVDAVRRAGVVNHMFSQVRSEFSSRVRETIQSGRLGELTALHFDLCFAKGVAGAAELGRIRQETPAPKRFELFDSKRELTNVGVYPLVLLFWLTGRNVQRVCCTTGNYFFAEHQKNDMEDFGQLLVEMDGGLTATVTAGRTGWQSHPSSGLNRAYLAGTQGAAVIDAYVPRAEVWADVEPWRPPARNPQDPMGMWAPPPGSAYPLPPKQAWITPEDQARVLDARYFLDCIQEGRSSDVSAELAAAATTTLMAAYQSAAAGRVVAIP